MSMQVEREANVADVVGEPLRPEACDDTEWFWGAAAAESAWEAAEQAAWVAMLRVTAPGSRSRV